MILQNFVVNGAVPLTREHLQAIIASNTEDILTQIRAMVQVRGPPAPSAVPMDAPNGAEDVRNLDAYQVWNWGDRIQMVPQGWRLPKITARRAWELWHFGIPSLRIQPLRRLMPFNLSVVSDKVDLSRLRRVMAELEDVILQDLQLPDGKERISDLSYAESSTLVEAAYGRLCRRLYNVESEDELIALRIEEKTYNTIHAQILRRARLERGA